MRKFTVLVLSSLLLARLHWPRWSQQTVEVPKTEFFVGYAFQHAGTSGSNHLAELADST